jgi:hypothetical protein
MSPCKRLGRIGRLLLAGAVVCPAAVSGQILPQETVSLAGGRLTLGGEVSATVAPDDDGRFNYTDYERSALQLLRLGVTASFRPIERIALVTELRAEGDTNGGPWTAVPFAAYVRVRPWKDRPLDIQAGRIPPVFGAAGRRIYANDNVLIGYPLAWQYLTVLRSDAVPSSTDELIYARAAGWRPGYSVGTPGYARGVPLTTAFRYDTGVQARLGGEHQRVSVATAVTAGTLSSPGARASNGGPQVSTRLAVRPATGLILGGSFADGRFFSESLAVPLPSTTGGSGGYSYATTPATVRYHQQTWGADAEYSIGHFLTRAELVTARWRLPPTGASSTATPIRSTGVSVEGRYRLAPGITAAARVDHLAFSRVRGSYQELSWDAGVSRVEGGLAWSVSRNVIVRGTVQHNTRSRGTVKSATLPALQVTVWF